MKGKQTIIAMALLFVFWGALPEAAFGERNERVREIRERADRAIRAEEWSEADKILSEGLYANPTAPELWVGRGFTQNRLGKIEEARRSFRNALGLYRRNLRDQPDHPGWIMNTGFLLVLLNSSDEATDFLAKESARLPHVEVLADFEEMIATLEENFAEWILPAPAEK